MPEEIQDTGLNFDLPINAASVIKVIGVGGGGSNAVNHMQQLGINGVDFIVCNTDAQALDHSPVINRIQLGRNITEGLGAGANPDVGKQAAQESLAEVQEILEHNTRMVFITAGMGGGTGTGAAPVIAKLARKMGILTVGIVTKPFHFEGKRRGTQAEKGIDELRKHVDSLIVINNDKLREVYGNLGFRSGFAKADEVLATAAKGIAEVITYHYTANIDLRDVKTVLENSGTAIMGSAMAGGETRAEDAVKSALDSPLLNDNHINGAKNVLLLIVSGTGEFEITMDEMSYINEHIQQEAGGDANVIMGIGINEEMNQAISVTVIATGFPSNQHDALTGKTPTKTVIPLNDDEPVQRDVHVKQLRDISDPDKPIRQAQQRQPDLFSTMDKENKVVHDLYEEESVEEDLAENKAQEIIEEPLEEQPVSEAKEEVQEVLPEANSEVEFEPTEAVYEEVLVEEDEEIEYTAFEHEDEHPLLQLEETEEVDNEIIPPIVIDEIPDEIEITMEEEVESETGNASPQPEMTADKEPTEEATHPKQEIQPSMADGVTFELDDIEGEGIELITQEDETESVNADEQDTEYDPFDFRIEDVMKKPEKESISLSFEPDTSEKVEAVAETQDSGIKRHTLEDLQKLEEQLQIKKPVQDQTSQLSETPVSIDQEEEEELLHFEVKEKEPSNSKQETISEEEEVLDRPINPARMKKIQERKKLLEQYSYKWNTSITEMLEKEPAYKRQGLNLGSDNHSQTSSFSEMTISGEGDETEIKTNNSFLHDNVD